MRRGGWADGGVNLSYAIPAAVVFLQCWHAIPAERPTFAEAIEVLEAMDA